MLSTPQQVSKGVSTMKHTTEQLEAIAAKLREMPPVEKKKQEHSKQEAVRVLSKEIAALQKRGYTLDQISETLRGEGLSIATPTLKSYLQRAKPTKKDCLLPEHVIHKQTAAEL